MKFTQGIDLVWKRHHEWKSLNSMSIWVWNYSLLSSHGALFVTKRWYMDVWRLTKKCKCEIGKIHTYTIYMFYKMSQLQLLGIKCKESLSFGEWGMGNVSPTPWWYPAVDRGTTGYLLVFDSENLSMKSFHVFIAGSISDWIDKKETIPSPHILLSHCRKLFLTSSIQHYIKWKRDKSNVQLV